MITKNTAERIWTAYNEIEKAKELLKEARKALERATEDTHTSMDRLRGRRVIEMGVPSGSNGHRILDVPIEIAAKVIDAHIEKQERALKELMGIAEIELKS